MLQPHFDLALLLLRAEVVLGVALENHKNLEKQTFAFENHPKNQKSRKTHIFLLKVIKPQET